MLSHRRTTARLLIVGLLCVGAGLATAGAFSAKRYPRPTGFVDDFARAMSRQSIDQLETVLSDLERKTGAEVAVVTVETVEGAGIEQAAVDLFKEWGIGKRGQDNGALILCAVQDRKVRIEVGYGLEPILPDAKCGRIIREQMVPYFKAGDLSTGLVAGGLAVAQIIAEHAGVTLMSGGVAPATLPVTTSRSEELWFLIFFVLFMLFLLSRGFFIGGTGGWGGDSGGGFGGGFGGFGGGGSGGGGASGGW